MNFRRYWVAECSFGGVNCEAQTLLDSKLPQSEALRTLEIVGWRWAGDRLACPPCAREELQKEHLAQLRRIAGVAP